jgi:penicillin G amidase
MFDSLRGRKNNLLGLLCAVFILGSILSCTKEDDSDGNDDSSSNLMLESTVEVLWDDRGVPHIYAKSESDVFLVQGYLTARDRMAQIDYQRRYVTGRLGELRGAADRGVDLLFRAADFDSTVDDWLADISTYGDGFRELTYAYASGVNSYLDDAELSRNDAIYAPHFAALGYKPEPFEVKDMMMAEKLLIFSSTGGPDADIMNNLIEAFIEYPISHDFLRFQPIEYEAIVPGFLDNLPASRAASTGSNRIPGAGVAGLLNANRSDQVYFMQQFIKKSAFLSPPGRGSNNWVVHKDLTADGFAILASDTHLPPDLPGIYYEVHLVAEETGLNVIGNSLPGTPLVVFGHNEYVAWAPTNSNMDISDVYEEELSDDGLTVLLNGEQVPVEKKVINYSYRSDPEGDFADQTEETIELTRVPHHGPVVPAELFPLDLGWVYTWKTRVFDAKSAAGSIYHFDKATSAEEFLTAAEYMWAGGYNFVCADVDGNICYTPFAALPVRETMHRENPPAMVMPGTGGYEWQDEPLAPELIPTLYNPDSGYAISSNNDTVGNTFDGDPFNDAVYYGWLFASGERQLRIKELLEQDRGAHTPETMMAIQADTLSVLARRSITSLQAAALRSPELLAKYDIDETMLDRLDSWDFTCGADSPEATIFHLWFPRVVTATLGDDLGMVSDFLFGDGFIGFPEVILTTRFVIWFLDESKECYETYGNDQPELAGSCVAAKTLSGTDFWDDATTTELESRDEILFKSLRWAMNWLTERYATDDFTAWKWSEIHRIAFVDNKYYDWLPEAAIEPIPMDGCLFSVDVANSNLDANPHPLSPDQYFLVDMVANNRTVTQMKPGDIKTWHINLGGQSEDPQSPHWASSTDDFVNNRYRDQPFYREQVEAAAVERWTFPAGFPLQQTEIDKEPIE